MIDDLELAVMNCFQDTRILCPACSNSRKKSKEKTLSIKIDGTTKIYHCFHCSAAGKVSTKPATSSPRDELDEFLRAPGQPNVIELPSATHDRELREFMGSRKISEATYRKYGVVTDIRWFGKKQGETLAVGFVYGSSEEPSAVKWRSLKGKAFTQSGAAQTFYGLENLPEDMTDVPLVICEGELDCLSIAQSLADSDTKVAVVSVPNGAPAKPVRHDDGVKFSYLWEAKELLESVNKIILAVDHDGPGDNLKQEIARRVGRGKCWEVEFTTELKDANAVLCAEGSERIKEIIDAATPMPLAGVFSAKDYQDKVEDLYDLGGTGKGLSTGFSSLDDLITITPSLYVVTGAAGSGKSAWLDAVMMNCADLHDMKWAICSMENPVHIHILKLAALRNGLPFFEGPTERMSKTELREATDWINDRFCFLENRDGEVATIDSIISRTKDALLRLGINGLLIDPYNFIENRDSRNEHQSISEMLSKVIVFAQAHQLVVFFVAHPTKQPFDAKSKPLDGNAISGSYSWSAKSDYGVSLFRTSDPNDHTPVVSVWKARFPWIAKRGEVSLNYDVATGRFSDLEEKDFDWSLGSEKTNAFKS